MSQTISAIASLLWPLIVLAVLLAFRGPLGRVIRSTEKRDFTVKIGGQEVSVGQLSRQQLDLTVDLQNELTALRKQVEALAPGATNTVITKAAPAGDPAPPPRPVSRAPSANGLTADTEFADTEFADTEMSRRRRPRPVDGGAKAPWERLDVPDRDADETAEPPGAPSAEEPGDAPGGGPPGRAWVGALPDTRPKPAGVLWVDDHPENNALQLDQLERNGVMVDTARSTREALQKLTGQRYQIIVSDLERVEDGKAVPDAGLELIRTVRAFDRETPVAIYTSARQTLVSADAAERSGATLVTASWYQLAGRLRELGLL